jgi:hypothetical protein
VVAPLYTVTNPVGPQQHNIAQENIAPGQTKYPPLWGIIKVTFKTGVKPHLLTSYAQITTARKVGEVTIAKTTLVVNAPSSKRPRAGRGRPLLALMGRESPPDLDFAPIPAASTCLASHL